MSPNHVLILIPAFNEAGAIRQVIDDVQQVIGQSDVLVIDDGSSDNTAEEVRKSNAFLLRHPFNLGIGGTFQTGLKFARERGYRYVIRVDGDGQHDPAHISSIYAALEANKADIVIGSRFLNTEPTMPIPWPRRIGILVFATTVSLLTRNRATDTTSGLIGLNRRTISILADQMPQDYPEVESRIILHRLGVKVLELPTPMRVRLAGISSITSWRSVYYAFKVTLATLLTVIKELPNYPQEMSYAHSNGAAHHGHYLQSHAHNGNHPTDP